MEKDKATKRAKTGGRQKGTPNKPKPKFSDELRKLISDIMPQLKNDILQLTPFERLQIAERLMQHIK